ncbi:carboxymuconolactone decarboxylase family protein [Streptomyces sp. NPDC059851]|uniref:carboxymuconolactone decarboxylase family protein n=1 Tax=Streptomyces sp. NPDC059851 TaxID=3346971 RepID=UPI00364A2A62
MTTHEHTDEAGTAHAHEHTPRMNLAQQVPDIYKAVLNLEMATRKGMDPVLLELVKIRASQLNHCAFCLDMHTKDALAGGESVQRIVQLSAWEESRHFYTEKEIAAIELTEAVTVLAGGTSQTKSGGGFVPDEVYEKAAKHFEEKELAQLIAVIATINVWNRFAVTTRMVPGHYTPGKHR